MPVPLTAGYKPDLKRIAEEAERAGGGLIYLCNPNNPTSLFLPKSEVVGLVNNLPKQTILVLDEAYLHFVEGWEQHSGLPWVREGKNVIVTRTFSKIYGMAGVRIGYACARPELIERFRPFRNNAVNVMGMRAVLASLSESAGLIPERRARLIKVRTELCQWLRARGLGYIQPSANFMMIEVGVEARELGLALLRKEVAVGRPFPPLNKLLRVTIGTAQDMERFREAFAQVYRT